MTAIKPGPSPPLGRQGSVPKLLVRHPHYPDYNTLVKLPALDPGDTVNYDAALIICGIIADDSWSTGWFARSADGSNRCEPGAPLATADGDVYYFVKDHTYKYPVYLSWDHWRVPEADAYLPSVFSSLPIEPPPPSLQDGGGYMEDLRSRDTSCCVSGILDFCEQAHLVPAAEGEWWDANMCQNSSFEIESAFNGMLLRTDLHRSLDTGTWVPMAKEGRLVVYVVRMTHVSNQFAELWHNVEMQKLVGVDRRCLFARVAWAVLSLHHEFLVTRRLAKENLLVRMKSGELKEMAPEIFQQFSRSRSRHPSPTKRPRLQALQEEAGVIIAAELDWTSEAGGEAGNDWEDKEQQLCRPDDDFGYRRGRKRFRSPSPLTIAAAFDGGIDSPRARPRLHADNPSFP